MSSRLRSSNMTRPAVGSIRRDMQRTRVDLPEPDRPMMMKISPSRTTRLASRTAPMMPAASRSASLGAPFVRSSTASASAPNSFQMFSAGEFDGTRVAGHARRPSDYKTDGRLRDPEASQAAMSGNSARSHAAGGPGLPRVLVLVHPLADDLVQRRGRPDRPRRSACPWSSFSMWNARTAA